MRTSVGASRARESASFELSIGIYSIVRKMGNDFMKRGSFYYSGKSSC